MGGHAGADALSPPVSAEGSVVGFKRTSPAGRTGHSPTRNTKAGRRRADQQPSRLPHPFFDERARHLLQMQRIMHGRQRQLIEQRQRPPHRVNRHPLPV